MGFTILLVGYSYIILTPVKNAFYSDLSESPVFFRPNYLDLIIFIYIYNFCQTILIEIILYYQKNYHILLKTQYFHTTLKLFWLLNVLKLSTLYKVFSGWHFLNYFFYFYSENMLRHFIKKCFHRIWHSMQIVYGGENWYEISKPVLWLKKKKKNVIHVSTADWPAA